MQQVGFISGGLAATLRFSSWATKWLGSQNCFARWSAILPRALPLGDVKSVGKIGSQTTRTRSFVSEWLARNFSAAEAPRRHVAHVGESKRRMRGWSAAASNAFWNSLKLDADKMESGGCPAGVLDGPQRYTPAASSSTATTSAVRSRFLISCHDR
jgi:hypothetical protein